MARRRRLPGSGDLPLRVACYARVSTEDQAERDTVVAQTDFLRRYCDLHGIPVAGVYVDDGISGATVLEDRPEGRRLLRDAEAGAFTAVLVYRLDRLGRSLTALMGAHDRLADLGVAIRSGTEPFDTATPFGKLVFSLLGSIAELERATISERMTLGRNRVARGGKHTGGPVPFGYDLDADGRLVPSERMVDRLGLSEADYVRDLFKRVADREATLVGEAIRLMTLGVPRVVRYGGPRGRERVYTRWRHNILGRIIHNTVYRGVGRVRSQFGHVERPAPPLVDDETWHRAQDGAIANRTWSRKNAGRAYLLRGLIRCGLCGRAYTGTLGTNGKERYRCSAQSGSRPLAAAERCAAGTIDAATVETAVWRRIRAVVDDPSAYIDAVRARLERPPDDGAAERAAILEREIAAKAAERERVRELARRGAITMDEAERDLGAIAREATALRELLAAIRMQATARDAQGEYLSNLAVILQDAARIIEEIETGDDREGKRGLIERLVWRAVVETEILSPGPRRRRARTTTRIMLYGEEDAR